MIDFRSSVAAAYARIRDYVRKTPIEPSPVLSELTGATVFLKLENLQVTGAFKARGAFNKLLTLSEEERRRGYVTASSGNHGTAVAYAAKQLHMNGITFVPEGAAPLKIANMRRLGCDVRTFGSEGGASEVHARAYAKDHGMTYVSPYNDPIVVAGQGTIGIELGEQVPELQGVVVAVGGGGLISGIAGYLKGLTPELRVIGVSPQNSMAMIASVQAGHIVETEHLPTLSDGTAGGLEPGAITFDLCRDLVDRFETVSEDEIGSALRLFIDSHHMLCEGAAAAAIAGLLKAREAIRGSSVAVIICGANISSDHLRSAL
ncbi:MAG: threonine/serine dehydratase [Candidatus Eremiobacteraeota bacterium]|nr:threonine/serine dehydratase [Candidatus Eremiobacteraeota bacterium]MBV8204348.1 threonine/serine dehydratase [Candidatus Eremiobacteraeota bacterium]MBV8461055.1 threonine/serine dehydratase [Candidatus Eremiobacteraeota bacterium]MBV8596780.1 threonine/serine dehydratase [Candidatus Eremiobacteraeota bacterium]MBV8669699.1 threonine/serine dehydratase [Candidatus Eremiobacteraeota bacterium]